MSDPTSKRQFKVGGVYQLLTRIEGFSERLHVMTYLGGNEWNARPVAGTQQLKPEWIIGAVLIADQSQGIEDSRHYMNRRVAKQ